MNRKDYRIKVKVVFTIDVGVDDKLFAGQDAAERITREVFKDSFSRAHLIRIDTEEMMILSETPDESK